MLSATTLSRGDRFAGQFVKSCGQLPVQPHSPSTPALRLPDQQISRIPCVVEVPPFQREDLGDPAGQCAT